MTLQSQEGNAGCPGATCKEVGAEGSRAAVGLEEASRKCVIDIGEGVPSMYLLFLEDAMYVRISRPLLKHPWCQSRAWYTLGCLINIY